MKPLDTYVAALHQLEEVVSTHWPDLKAYRSGIGFNARMEIIGDSRNIHGCIYLTRHQENWVPSGVIGSANSPVGDRHKARRFANELTQICEAIDHCVMSLEGIVIEG